MTMNSYLKQLMNKTLNNDNYILRSCWCCKGIQVKKNILYHPSCYYSFHKQRECFNL